MAKFVIPDKILQMCEETIRLRHTLRHTPAAGDSKVFLDDDDLKWSESQLDEAGEIKNLKQKLYDLETRYTELMFEHEQANIDLAHEKHKVTQLERQLQFVKDNQTVFEKLREAYINMTYNETAGRKLVEIRDKSVQTWDGILCRACKDTEKLRIELEQVKAAFDGCIIIKPEELDSINQTVGLLKSCIQTEVE